MFTLNHNSHPKKLFSQFKIAFIVLALFSFLVLISKNINRTEFQAKQQRKTNPIAQPHVVESYSNIPLHFEENQGQADENVKFLARGAGYSMALFQEGFCFSFRESRELGDDGSLNSFQLKIILDDANPQAHISGLQKMPGKSNYFIGNDPTQWRTNVQHYARVQYEEIYPGIDLAFYGNQGQLEFDFVVAPGANPNIIGFTIEGTNDITLDNESQLHLCYKDEEVVFKRPNIYQIEGTAQKKISGGYRISQNTVSFEVDHYNSRLALVIDPVLIFSTYFGGSDSDGGEGIAVDNNGDIYITGSSISTDFPTLNAYQSSIAGSDQSYIYGDVIILKIKGDGSELVYSTFIGGTSADYGRSIAVDDLGNVYVTGTTSSDDNPATPDNEGFPTVNGFQNDSNDGYSNPFVLKLAAGGNNLLYSTYFGNGYPDQYGTDIAIDAARNCYILGSTFYGGIVTRNAYIAESPSYFFQYFVAKFNPSLSGDASLIYSTYLGGNGDSGRDWYTGAIAVTPDGSAIITGVTKAADYPVLNAVQSTKKGSQDAVVTKLSPDGSSLIFSTFLGGDGNDEGTDICLDNEGNIYVTGAGSSGFQTTEGAYQHGPGQPFFCKFTPSGTLVYAGRGGFGKIGVNENENVYLFGRPLDYQAGVDPVAILKLSKDGDALISSSPVTGTSAYIFLIEDMCVTDEGMVYLIGNVGDGSFETKNALQPQNNGMSDLFIAKLGESMDFYPDGVAFDPENWDESEGELQSSFLGLKVTGSNLDEVKKVIFKFNGNKDVYVEAQNIKAYQDSVTFDLAVIHGAELGGRDLILKNQDGTEIDVSGSSGKKFIVTRIKTFFNQAVDQNALRTHAFRNKLITKKRGVMRIEFDDDLQYNRTFSGRLRISGVSGDSTSHRPYTHRDGFTEQEIIDGFDYLFVPFPQPIAEGVHTFRCILERDDGLVIFCPNIKREFIESEEMEILYYRYGLKLSSGAVAQPPAVASVEAASEHLKRVYPISDDKLKLTDGLGGRVVTLPEWVETETSNFEGLPVTHLTDAGEDKLLHSLAKLLHLKYGSHDISNKMIVAVLPEFAMAKDISGNGNIDGVAFGLSIMGAQTSIVTPSTKDGSFNLWGTLAHELGHNIETCLSRIPILDFFGANDLGDEYENGSFQCNANPPVAGLVNFDGVASCTESPFVAGFHGDTTGIYSDRTAFDPWTLKPKFHYQGVHDTLINYNFMGNQPDDDKTWVSSRTYDILFNLFVPDVGVAKVFTDQIIELSGIIYETGNVILDDFYVYASGSVHQSLEGGQYTFEFQDASGNVMSRHGFDVDFIRLTNPPRKMNSAFFNIRTQLPAGAKKVVLKKDGLVLTSRNLSDNPPTVEINHPQDNQSIKGLVDISWTATDADGDPLTFLLYYATTEDQIILIAESLTETTYRLDTSTLPGSSDFSITVVASDGLNKSSDTVGNIRVSVHEPNNGDMKPDQFRLGQNYPNPFNPTTVIKYSIPKSVNLQQVKLSIFNLMGEEIRVLVDEKQQTGNYSVQWDGRTETGLFVPTGMYLYRLRAGSFVEKRKMILIH